MKLKKQNELAYFIGLIVMGSGAALMAKADLGVSMVVAPAYILYQKVSFLSYGQAEYIIQAILLIIFCIVMRRFHWTYLLSFITAVIYGFILDGFMELLTLAPMSGVWSQIGYYTAGLLLTAFGVTMFFRTYLPPEVYELFVKGISTKYKKKTNIVKWIYDIASCVISIILSFILFGKIVGIGVGTIVCALINGIIIGFMGRLIDKVVDFSPRFPKLKAIVSDRSVTNEEK